MAATSSNESGGFFFTFGEEDKAVTGVTSSVYLISKWPSPTIPMTEFPLYTLSDETVAGWLATPLPVTKQQHLHLRPSDGSGSKEYAVQYQIAPEVKNLTEVVDSDLGAELRDIVPGKYYGGLKVWSCAPDLARYMVSNEREWRSLLSSAQCVVEVGCGQGIPGLTALLLGARHIVFQDYNQEVLDLCMKPNIAMTMMANKEALAASSSSSPSVQLVHGDWVDLGLPAGGSCDVILGSDVTFDKEACEKLSVFLSRWLRRGSGVAYIATKVFYFGTNGGSLELQQCAEQCGLVSEEVLRLDENGGMQRVVMRVRWPQNS